MGRHFSNAVFTNSEEITDVFQDGKVVVSDGSNNDSDQYFKDIGKYKLLSRKEERRVAINIAECRKAIWNILFSSLLIYHELMKKIEAMKNHEIRLEAIITTEKARWFTSKKAVVEKNKLLNFIKIIQKIIDKSDELRKVQKPEAVQIVDERKLLWDKVLGRFGNIALQEDLVGQFVELFLNGIFQNGAKQLLLNGASGLDDDQRRKYLLIEERSRSEIEKMVSRLRFFLREKEKNEKILAEANIRLVISIVRKYSGYGFEFMDLVQIGNSGLLKAVSRFDYTKGFRFGTYASHWIRQAITMALFENSNVIRTPMYMATQARRVSRAKDELKARNSGIMPNNEQLAKEAGITSSQLKNVQLIPSTTSLDKPINTDDGEGTIEQFISDPHSSSMTDKASFVYLQDQLEKVLSTLTEREEEILRLRFGMDDGMPKTLEEVGVVFSLTRERIRQIEKKALKKMRHRSRSDKLRKVLDKL